MRSILCVLMIAMFLFVWGCFASEEIASTDNPVEEKDGIGDKTVTDENKSLETEGSVKNPIENPEVISTSSGPGITKEDRTKGETGSGQMSLADHVGHEEQGAGTTLSKETPAQPPVSPVSDVPVNGQLPGVAGRAAQQQLAVQPGRALTKPIASALGDSHQSDTPTGMQGASQVNDNRHNEHAPHMPQQQETPIVHDSVCISEDNVDFKKVLVSKTKTSSATTSSIDKGDVSISYKSGAVPPEKRTGTTHSVGTPSEQAEIPGTKVVFPVPESMDANSIAPESTAPKLASTGAESTMDSTPKAMEEDISSTQNHKGNSRTQTLPLPLYTVSNALPLHNSVDKADGILCSSSLFALAALATLAVAAAAPAH